MTMANNALFLAGLLLVFSPSLFGSVSPSEWDRYCRKCHIERPVNSLYDPSIKAHKNTSLSCVFCHSDKGIAGHVRRSAEDFLLLIHDMTLPPDIGPQKPSSMTSDDCLGCHPYIREIDEIEPRKLPKAVRPIRLRAAHDQHWDYRTFPVKSQDKLKALITQKTKSALEKTEQAELDRLSRIEKMRCSRCHERFRKDSPGGFDPNVSIAMKNPMECTSCHVRLSNVIHPGDNAPLPSAVSCERCHHGKLHQKMTFFPVDCGTNSDCLRCHPGYTPDELAKINQSPFVHKTTAGLPQKNNLSGAVFSTPIFSK
jgi:hypothetical protein